jgi:hypothetical protein
LVDHLFAAVWARASSQGPPAWQEAAVYEFTKCAAAMALLVPFQLIRANVSKKSRKMFSLCEGSELRSPFSKQR